MIYTNLYPRNHKNPVMCVRLNHSCVLVFLKCSYSSVSLQDLLMVTYLANLTQAQIALNEKLVVL